MYLLNFVILGDGLDESDDGGIGALDERFQTLDENPAEFLGILFDVLVFVFFLEDDG
jgi:hypothetical protein